MISGIEEAVERAKAPYLAEIIVFLLLCLLAVTFRLPWFFQDVINWDESAFILIGQALADGHLPYTVAWDNKPPLGFAFFAFLVALVPDSLAFIRFGGSVLVAVAAYFVFRISVRLMARHYAFLAATLFVIAASVLITAAMAVMMEHVALVPLLGALLLIGERRVSKSRLFAAGALLGAAAMVRPNLVFVLMAGPLLFLITGSQLTPREKWFSAASIVSGGLAAFAAVFAIYFLGGHASLLVDTVIRVPLGYSQAGSGPLAAAEQLLRYAFRLDDPVTWLEPRRVLSIFFWVTGAVGAAVLVLRRQYRSALMTFVLGFLVATLASMLASGFVWEHHLIQLTPFFAIGAALVISIVAPVRRPQLVAVAVGVLAIGFTFSRADFYVNLADALGNGREIYSGENFALARYLEKIALPDETLFVTNDILLYWLMDTYPLTPMAAFPAALWEEEAILKPLLGPAMTTEAALRDILAHQPSRIVIPAVGSHSEIAAGPRRNFPQELLDDYELENTVAGRHIYKRGKIIGS